MYLQPYYLYCLAAKPLPTLKTLLFCQMKGTLQRGGYSVPHRKPPRHSTTMADNPDTDADVPLSHVPQHRVPTKKRSKKMKTNEEVPLIPQAFAFLILPTEVRLMIFEYFKRLPDLSRDIVHAGTSTGN
jgi:hypothetical protein